MSEPPKEVLLADVCVEPPVRDESLRVVALTLSSPLVGNVCSLPVEFPSAMWPCMDASREDQAAWLTEGFIQDSRPSDSNPWRGYPCELWRSLTGNARPVEWGTVFRTLWYKVLLDVIFLSVPEVLRKEKGDRHPWQVWSEETMFPRVSQMRETIKQTCVTVRPKHWPGMVALDKPWLLRRVSELSNKWRLLPLTLRL